MAPALPEFLHVGNRSAYDPDGPGALNHTMAYATGNREATASDGTGLVYDFKGNVTERGPLSGAAKYVYEWDEYDRMTKVTRLGQVDVEYAYDADGRLLKRQEDPGGSAEATTINYWVGLNKIAEERWGPETGRDKVIFRPDDESNADPTVNGWEIDGGVGALDMDYVTDEMRGNVLRVWTTASGRQDGSFLIGDTVDSVGSFQETDQFHLALWFNNANTAQINDIEITVFATTTGGEREMVFKTLDGIDEKNANVLTYFLGAAGNDGNWHYLELDLESRLDELETLNLTEIHGMRFECNDLYLDDVIFSGGMLEKSYQIVADMVKSGYLGAQSGEHGGDEGQASWSKWYYHYDELGTLVVSTDSAGDGIGVYEPDYFGNYPMSHAYGNKPDSLGLQSKFYEAETGLYYFGARWYDPQRGRWLSEDPLGMDGPNLYAFVLNDPSRFFDPDGRATTTDDPFFGENPKKPNESYNNWMKRCAKKVKKSGMPEERKKALRGEIKSRQRNFAKGKTGRPDQPRVKLPKKIPIRLFRWIWPIGELGKMSGTHAPGSGKPIWDESLLGPAPPII